MKRAAKQALCAALQTGWIGSGALWSGLVGAAELGRALGLGGLAGGAAARRAQTVLHLKHERSADWLEARLRALSPDLCVRAGPFQGLRYPCAAAHGGALGPKILGTYEREIAPFFEAWAAEAVRAGAPPYDTLINIGSAEGYYAVGALRAGIARRAIGFELSPSARALAAAMAAENGVAERYEQRAACGRADLLDRPPGRLLVLCDCEGYERALFDDAVARRLSGADVVIEVHEHLGASLGALRGAFAPTHEVTCVTSVSDRARADYPGPPAFLSAPLRERLLLAAELRAPMTWLIAQARRSPTARPAPLNAASQAAAEAAP